jgi:hypothetical protein
MSSRLGSHSRRLQNVNDVFPIVTALRLYERLNAVPEAGKEQGRKKGKKQGRKEGEI